MALEAARLFQAGCKGLGLWKELPWEGDMVRAEPLDRSRTENTELAKRLLEWYLKVSTEGGGRSRLPNYLEQPQAAMIGNSGPGSGYGLCNNGLCGR